MSEGNVVHVLGNQSYDVYVGRAASRYGLKESLWANPHRIGHDGTKEEVLAKYEQRMVALLYDAPGRYPAFYPWFSREDLKADLAALHGKTLACWCAPKGGRLNTEDDTVCHGQILLRLAKGLNQRSQG